jgi:hypothetical protein
MSTLHTSPKKSSTNRFKAGPSPTYINMDQYVETAKIPLKRYPEHMEKCGVNRLYMSRTSMIVCVTVRP